MRAVSGGSGVAATAYVRRWIFNWVIFNIFCPFLYHFLSLLSSFFPHPDDLIFLLP
jgi:hypothetical protein